MTLVVKTLASAEVIRDGGSLAAFFYDQHDAKWVLLLPLRLAFREDPAEKLGFAEPVLIDAAPESRPADTPVRINSVLPGPSSPLTWKEAQALTAQFMSHSAALNETAQEALNDLRIAIDCEGKLPPGMARAIVHSN